MERYSVREQTKGKDVSEVECNPASGAMDPWYGSPPEDLERDRKVAGMPCEADGDRDAPSTDVPQANSGLLARGSSYDSPR